MANYPSYAGVTGISGPFTITAQHTTSSYSNGGNLGWSGGVSVPDLILIHGKSQLVISYGGLIIMGDVREAALALAKHLFETRDGGAISTTYNQTLKVHHSKGDYYLEYLPGNKSEVFDELNEEFKRICKLKAFA